MTSARKCSATKINGRPCRAWAVRESDPPLCNRHMELLPAGKTIIVAEAASAPVIEAPPEEAFFASSDPSLEGPSLEALSLEAPSPETPSPETPKETPEESSEEAHTRATLEFYGRSFTIEEAAALVNLALAGSLNGEVAATRVAIRHAFQQLEEELSPSDYTQLAGIIFTGANTIARLLRAKRSLSGEAADGIIGAMARGSTSYLLSGGWTYKDQCPTVSSVTGLMAERDALIGPGRPLDLGQLQRCPHPQLLRDGSSDPLTPAALQTNQDPRQLQCCPATTNCPPKICANASTLQSLHRPYEVCDTLGRKLDDDPVQRRCCLGLVTLH